MDLPLLPAGRRLDWEQLPATVRQALQARLGSPVVQAATQPGGFSPGLAARLRLADGRRVFVKAAGPDPNPHTPALHRAEAHITAAPAAHGAQPPPAVVLRPSGLGGAGLRGRRGQAPDPAVAAQRAPAGA